ncbi:hypothetical protein [Gimesia aquarii]|uniref:Uncharacterized protein n=1 Tax=Gimesia aquarii TaxID=2527964 RepID=A0A517WYQ1_9PLAN|nr:hypothetical protein [Gimesia aquarii]QDU10389.1 hypothetical protein V202x_37880 [Gimesia aquarii]
MSMRDHFFSVTSIEPIRTCIASGDRAVVEGVIKSYLRGDLDYEDEDEDDPEFREAVEEMITCVSPPKKEPGCWIHVLEHLAQYLELSPDFDLPFNEGWKHSHVWPPYRKLVKRHISRQSRKSLGYLDDGRPFRGRGIDYDGCVFSWLSADEVKELSNSLSNVDASVITDPDLIDFHETLTESLQIVAGQSRDLIAGA